MATSILVMLESKLAVVKCESSWQGREEFV